MIASALPDPLVPAEVDLRGYEFMPYYGDRLRESDLNVRATDAEYRAAHNLWWSSWKQVPAASLPDDDAALARLADLGRNVKGWRKVKEVALRGFVLCSDGRLYHRVLAPLAMESWEKRDEFQERRENERERQRRHRDERKRIFEELRKHGIVPSFDTPTTTLRADLSRVTSGLVTPPVTAAVTVTGEDVTGDVTAKRGEGEERERTVVLQKQVNTEVHAPTGGNGKANPTAATIPTESEAPPTLAGAMAAELIRKGVGVTSMHPTLLHWIADGFTIPQTLDAVEIARQHKPAPEKIAANYLDRILRNPPKASQPSWWSTDQGVLAKGRELSLEARPGETMNGFQQRIREAMAKQRQSA